MNAEIERKIDAILEKMTLEEKIWQMGMIQSSRLQDENGNFSKEKADTIYKGYSIGGIQDARLGNPADSAKFVKDTQEYIQKYTKPGIPAIVVGETLHGYMAPHADIFPQTIGLASAFDRELVREVAKASAQQAKAVGVNMTPAPDLDLAEDPRWGRVEETYGEDWYLTSELGCAFIQGAQHEDNRIVTAVKHYAAHGLPERGINIGPVSCGERALKSKYLRPFKRAVQDVATGAVLPAYNDFDGIPIHANKYLMKDMLRDYIGFEGMTVEDYSAVEMFVFSHKTAADYSEAGRQAVEAGLDFEAGEICCYGERLLKLVKDGVVSEEKIDTAVRRILRTKFFAGIMENALPNVETANAAYYCQSNRRLARKAAEESIVLLENDGILPLEEDIKVALIGPLANREEVGDYALPNESVVTLLQGLLQNTDLDVEYVEGCDLWRISEEGFPEAIAAAKRADVCILALGESSTRTCGIGWGTEGEEESLCGEGFDSHDLQLAGSQMALAKAVIETGKPVIGVLINGRPLQIEYLSEHANALIEAWYPGEEGGNVLADILMGKVNPSGKLPISFPKSVGQIPIYYSHKPSAAGYYKQHGSRESRGRDYVFADPFPLYPFGYGKSYTSFVYSDLQVPEDKITDDKDIPITVTVTNTGDRDGTETVLLYVNDVVSSVTTPVRQLVEFQRVHLQAGESKTVSFRVQQRNLEIVDADYIERVENGEFKFYTGNLDASVWIEK